MNSIKLWNKFHRPMAYKISLKTCLVNSIGQWNQFHSPLKFNSIDVWIQFHRPKKLIPYTKRTKSIDQIINSIDLWNQFYKTRTNSIDLWNHCYMTYWLLWFFLTLDLGFWRHQQQQCLLSVFANSLRVCLSLSTPHNQIVCN